VWLRSGKDTYNQRLVVDMKEVAKRRMELQRPPLEPADPIASLAHDVGNRLGVIKVNVSLLRRALQHLDKEERARLEERLTRIDQAADDVSRSVRQACAGR
jgi:hypothetical protein